MEEMACKFDGVLSAEMLVSGPELVSGGIDQLLADRDRGRRRSRRGADADMTAFLNVSVLEWKWHG